MNPINYNKRLKVLAILVAVFLVLLTSYEIYYSTTFHIIKTNPGTSNIANTTPFLKVYFSKTISTNNLSVSYSDPSIILSKDVNGKILTFNLSTPTVTGKTYTITINSVFDTAGKKLKNLKLSFKPRYVDASSLPADQKAVLLERQSSSANKVTATFLGTNSLINKGLSTNQVLGYEQAVKNFAKAGKFNLSSVSIDTNGVSSGPLDGSGVFTLNFSVAINSTSYQAKLQYSGATSVELFLYNSKTKVQVFDSGSIST